MKRPRPSEDLGRLNVIQVLLHRPLEAYNSVEVDQRVLPF